MLKEVIYKSRKTVPLRDDWAFKEADDVTGSFLHVPRIPTNVHLDLMNHGRIPDPFLARNEVDVQWVGEKAWLYQKKFSVSVQGMCRQGNRIDLVFDGLDTYASVYLNGTLILETNNMFCPERVDVTEALVQEGTNELSIRFDSAIRIGKQIVKKYPSHHWGCWNGDVSRLTVRKAQYHYVNDSHLDGCP